MNVPFTSAEFYSVFSAYNTAVWPMQLLLMALGVLAIVLLIRQREHASVGISAILTFLWVWQAAFVFDVQADLGLIGAGILGLVLIVQSKNLTAASGEPSSL